MRIVYEATGANLAKAKDILITDDILSRQSMYVRTAASLNMKSDATYIIFEGSEEAAKRADELLKDFVKKAANSAEVLKKFDEIENASAEGFGFLGI